jgi:hypothetical protein
VGVSASRPPFLTSFHASLAMIPTLPAEVHVMILRWCIAVLPCRTPRLVDGRHIWESELEPHLMKHRKSALVDLCLVSRVHRFHAQRALFSQFTVGIDSSARRTPAAALFWPRLLFFILHPHLSRHVITLVLYGNDGVRTRDALAVLAGTFPNVENMVVNNCQEQYIRAQILHGLAPQLHSLRNIHGQITYSYDLDYDLIGFPLIQQGLDRVALKQLNFSTIIPFAAGRTLAKFLTSETRETLRSLSIKLHGSFEYCAVRDCLRNIGSFSALSVLSLTILTTPLLLEVISLDSGKSLSLQFRPTRSLTLDSQMAMSLLARYPTFPILRSARPGKLTAFFYFATFYLLPHYLPWSVSQSVWSCSTGTGRPNVGNYTPFIRATLRP